MTTQLPFSSNTIQVFAYEGFSYTISNPDPNVYTLATVSNSTGFGVNPSPLYFTKDGDNSYLFSVSDLSNNLTPGTQESFLLQAIGPTTLVSSNIVNIGAGRFLDGSGQSLSNNAYTFFKNERISPIRLVAPSFTLKVPTSIPSLPPGLSFVQVASNIYDISGIPLVTAPLSNYLVIGAQNGGSKIVTTRFNLSVSNERVQVNVSGSPIINNMTVGSPISPRVLTSVPPVGSTAVRYSFPTLPDGIVATDLFGNVKTSPATITADPSYTLILSGTPTLTAANTFRDAGATSSGLVYPFQISRTNPLPIVDATQSITFAFGETVLFDTPVLQPLYAGVPVDPSKNFFRALTYFAGSVDMSDIVSPDLRSDLSLAFIPSLSRANLFAPSGSPGSAGTGTFTIRAINSNGITRDLQQTITVLNDSVSFSSPVGVDLCYNFILSRPVSQAKTGYYPGTIQFSASAVSGLPVILSAPALTGTGLSLSSTGLVSGIPTAVTPLTDLVVTANVSGSPATATKTVKFAILNDTFTFADLSASFFNFVQNRASVPFQVQATTLSERGVTGFSQIGLPAGLSISPAGVVSGTPTASSPLSGNATISATTGYASGSRDFSYNLTPDAMIFFTPQTSYSFRGGDPVGPIDIDGLAYSGITVSNYDLSISPTYGMTLNSSTGVLGGTWTTGVPPDVLLPSSCNFTITAKAGQLTGTLNLLLTGTVISNAMLVSEGGDSLTPHLYSISPSNLTVATSISVPVSNAVGIGGLRIRQTNISDTTILGSFPGQLNILRGSNLGNLAGPTIDIGFQFAPFLGWCSPVNDPGTSTWWIGGQRLGNAVLLVSTDDGLNWSNMGEVESPVSPSERRPVVTRNINGGLGGKDPYLNSFALAYDSGILMAGGGWSDSGYSIETMLRSSNRGTSWNKITGSFSRECAAFSLDTSSIWIATGSDEYQTWRGTTVNPPMYTVATDTIKYSLNKGASWINAVGTFNMFGYDVAYGCNTWIATGVSYDSGTATYSPELRVSSNGISWTKFDLSTNPVVAPSAIPPVAPLRIGPVVFDSNYWYVFVNQDASPAKPVVYRHDVSTSLTSGWVPFDLSGISNAGSTAMRFHSATPSRFLYTNDPPVRFTLTFPGTAGPTITSPVSRSFVYYQYVPIEPIQVSATGSGTVYFFVDNQDLPAGLSFSPLTNQITGSSVRQGTDTLTIYAKDNNGVTAFTITFTTLIPRIIRQQDGAGAYTSLLRQYTEVLGAQNARDSRVFPTQESRLGEFMSPEAPDVVTQTVDPRCFDPKACL